MHWLLQLYRYLTLQNFQILVLLILPALRNWYPAICLYYIIVFTILSFFDDYRDKIFYKTSLYCFYYFLLAIGCMYYTHTHTHNPINYQHLFKTTHLASPTTITSHNRGR